MFFHLVMSVGQRKKSESPGGIEPQTFRFPAPMLYHWATEVHLTCVLHTARISNVDSVMFVDRIGEMVSFKLKTCHLSYFYPQIYMYSLPKNGEIALNSTKLRHKDHWIIV